ncbi:conserved hypothetical protein [Candidatus Terasakiella magnetica]|uniref:Methyltransferase domain-containing protein n=1 Tax=Candidatus Terasakiella magnetica TaxID=1867952 RepID=A0A1C3RKR4_9PROT|nr:class I SAM-dependent methyltransferase [Candidatus Terasakiella magnetica]SCA57845.1 conserved hypothetical protein [Candidatus Terasakiella magnetica]
MSAEFDQKLSLDDFAQQFGMDVSDISEEMKEFIASKDFSYRFLDGKERDKTAIEILERRAWEKSIAGEGKVDRWNKGWGENLQAFLDSKCDLETLIPKYIRPGQPVRLFKHFAKVADDEFELNWYRIFRDSFFRKYLSGFNEIYEFGSGSGHNVAVLAKMYPESKINAFDWAEPSVDIVNHMRDELGLNVCGRHFDFFNPDTSVKIAPNSAVLTMGALEQTGDKFHTFLEYILDQKPTMCFHEEPIVEVHDDDNMVDYTSLKTMERRNFLNGLVKTLREYEEKGWIEIKKVHRSQFGSLMFESYAQVIWQPK